MAHEIESNFVYGWDQENSQCKNCTGFSRLEFTFGQGMCSEAKNEVPEDAHCDFFQSRD